MADEQKLEFCQVDVAGTLIHYRWEGNDIDGCDSFDEDVSSWSDSEIREMASGVVGIEDPGDIKLIEISR